MIRDVPMPPAPIPLCVPHLAGNEWKYVKECLDTNWVSYVGDYVDRFERQLALQVGARHAVAVCSGTAALHLALVLAGVGAGDEVVMPGLTFVAPANAVRYCGAWPTFVDVERDWQIDVAQLAAFLDRGCERRSNGLVNRTTGRRVAALMPIHLLGGMGDVDALAELALRHELPLIEDAAQCLGAQYDGRPIGAPARVEVPLRIVATSFNGNKIVTTGGGGALLTSDEALAARARHLTTHAKNDRIEFSHDAVGYNYRLTNLAAALGVAQLEQLDAHVRHKRSTARAYGEALREAGLQLHPEPARCTSTFWMYTVLCRTLARPSIDRLIERGIEARPLWIPLHRLPAFDGHAHVVGADVANRLYAQALSLPCSVGISDEEIGRVCAALLEILAAQSRRP